MEPEPWAPPCLLGDGSPAAQRGGGHAVPTCLGSHRGAEERLETGGAELADRPHAAGVPRRMPPAPGGQGRDGQRSGRGAQRPDGSVWPSRGLPGTRQVAGTEGSSPVPGQGASRAARAVPAVSGAGSGCARGAPAAGAHAPAPANPRRTGTPARATAGATAGASKPLGGRGVWELPSSPPGRAACPRQPPCPRGGPAAGYF